MGEEVDLDMTAARAAYEAYGEDVGGVNVNGAPLPAWEDLGEKVQHGWLTAVLTVRRMRVDYGPQPWHGDPPPVGRNS